jgi:glycogen synthase
MITFSIVINTLNRAKLLNRTIDSFRCLRYRGNYEVIVVNGPSTDNTDEVIAYWRKRIRVGKCDVANLSVSRNIGICMSRGDVVAFIDDDAIPEPEWLTQLAVAYDREEIGGVGGVVYDQTGYTYQYEYSTADRLGNANWRAGKRTEQLCFPGSFEFPYLQGTNASFRRSALLEVGGFDEEFEYYLDETELCCRLVDAGYVIRQLPKAFVHHKFAPSHVRDDQKITRYRYPVLKNKIYFALKHGRRYLSLSEILEDGRNFTQAHAKDVEFHIAGGRLADVERQHFRDESDRAWECGLQRGLSSERRMIDEEKRARYNGDFLQFSPDVATNTKSIVLVCRDFPPNHSGGIATFNKDLAEALGEEGHLVHVITQSADINRVDLENGVWVHRVVMREIIRTAEAEELRIPQHIWNWSATALAETRRIATHRSIDVVEAPIWDCEGIALLLAKQWPVVTSLHTTLYFWLESHPELSSDAAWMASFGNPMLGLEKQLMLRSDSIRSNSSAIRFDIENAYRFEFEESKICIAPHGLSFCEPRVYVPQGAESLVVLFVGRLEHRKGIDVLLNVIPAILDVVPNVSFRIIGDDSLLGPNGKTYKEEFLERHAKQDLLEKVVFEGRVSDEEVREAYSRCDIFVAPSRFESFGLVFLEAMREGKPVIGCAAGGMPEIIAHEKNGLLVKPNSEDSLKAAILRLIQDGACREAMGRSGRRIFEETFTSARMAQKSARLYELAAANFRNRLL